MSYPCCFWRFLSPVLILLLNSCTTNSGESDGMYDVESSQVDNSACHVRNLGSLRRLREFKDFGVIAYFGSEENAFVRKESRENVAKLADISKRLRNESSYVRENGKSTCFSRPRHKYRLAVVGIGIDEEILLDKNFEYLGSAKLTTKERLWIKSYFSQNEGACNIDVPVLFRRVAIVDSNDEISLERINKLLSDKNMAFFVEGIAIHCVFVEASQYYDAVSLLTFQNTIQAPP